MKRKEVIEGLKDPKDNPCWKGYKPVGTKKKGGRTVPNCVPTESVSEEQDQENMSETAGKLFKGVQIEVRPNQQGGFDVVDTGNGISKAVVIQSFNNVNDANKQAQMLDQEDIKALSSMPPSIQVYDKPMTTKETRGSYYNPMDYERQQQRQMDYERRAFKRAELQHELGHEDDPDFERNFRRQQIERDRGPWYLKINGKILKSKGEVKVFDWKKGAVAYGNAILKNKPELQGKIYLTKKNQDDVAEDSGTLKVQKDDDKSTVLVNPATGVQTQIDKTNPNAPRLTQDEQGKLKLSIAQGAQTGGQEQKPNLVGKDVQVSTTPVEDVHRIGATGHPHGDEEGDVHTRSAITGDEEHDEITKLLVTKLRKLAGLGNEQ